MQGESAPNDPPCLPALPARPARPLANTSPQHHPRTCADAVDAHGRARDGRLRRCVAQDLAAALQHGAVDDRRGRGCIPASRRRRCGRRAAIGAAAVLRDGEGGSGARVGRGARRAAAGGALPQAQAAARAAPARRRSPVPAARRAARTPPPSLRQRTPWARVFPIAGRRRGAQVGGLRGWGAAPKWTIWTGDTVHRSQGLERPRGVTGHTRKAAAKALCPQSDLGIGCSALYRLSHKA
jgi:hypothetical protein